MTMKPTHFTPRHDIEWYALPSRLRSLACSDGTIMSEQCPPMAIGALRPPGDQVRAVYCAGWECVSDKLIVNWLWARTPVCLGLQGARMVSQGRLHPVDAFFMTTFPPGFSMKRLSGGFCHSIDFANFVPSGVWLSIR